MRRSSRNPSIRCGSLRTSCGTGTRQWPESNWRICLIEESKENGALTVTRRPSPTTFAYTVRARAWDRLSALACSTTTPLGWPLVPEVKIM